MITQNTKAIELVVFKPRQGVSIDEVKNSLEFLNPILKSYKGFIDRQLAVNNENQWMDIVLWESMNDAKFAADDIMQQKEAVKAFNVIDEKEMRVFHFEPVS